MSRDTNLRESIYERMAECLSHKREVILAYAFGSFLEGQRICQDCKGPPFRREVVMGFFYFCEIGEMGSEG